MMNYWASVYANMKKVYPAKVRVLKIKENTYNNLLLVGC